MRAMRRELAVFCPVLPSVQSSTLPSNPRLERTGVEVARYNPTAVAAGRSAAGRWATRVMWR